MFNVHHLVSATARLFLSLADKNDNAWNFRHRAMNWLEMEVAKNQENQLFMERSEKS